MNQFLPVTKADLAERGWEEFDFLVTTGDAYVDHPSFGPAIISRVLEAEGYRVAILAQPVMTRKDVYKRQPQLRGPPESRSGRLYRGRAARAEKA